jgi:hypothetical protein
MPWYKVPVALYLEAGDAAGAQDRALALLPGGDPDGPLSSADYPVELTGGQVDSWRRMREVLRQARADAGDGLAVPGVRFTPGAAADLAALEFEEQQPE